MAENKDAMDVMDTEPKTKNDEPENTQDSQKETLTVFKKAKKSKKVKTGFIVGLAGFTGKSKKEPTTEEIIDVEPEEEETAE